MTTGGKNCFERFGNQLSLRLSRLDALSPLKTLARGYSVSRRCDNESLIRSIEDIAKGERIETILADGRLISMIESIRKES